MSRMQTDIKNDGSAQSANDVTQILTERGHRYGKFTGHANVTQDLKNVIDLHLNQRNKALADDQQEGIER